MKKIIIFKIKENSIICPGRDNSQINQAIWKMVLEGDTSEITAAGQFVNIELDKRYLRRPISICDWGENSLELVYRVVGNGTLDMSKLSIGDKLELLVGLGNGFDTSVLTGNKINHADVNNKTITDKNTLVDNITINDNKLICKETITPILVGGGVGLPPMVGLAKTLLKDGYNPLVIAGFNTQSDMFLIEDFERLGVMLIVATMDGSFGIKGTVCDAIEAIRTADSYIFACGPKPMLKAISQIDIDGQFSVEERMGCGFGVCMGCTCKTKSGMKRVCKDGPVFKKEDLLW